MSSARQECCGDPDAPPLGGVQGAPAAMEAVCAGAGPKVDKVLKVKGHIESKRNRGFDITQCVVNVTNPAAFIVRVILQLRSAGQRLPRPQGLRRRHHEHYLLLRMDVAVHGAGGVGLPGVS